MTASRAGIPANLISRIVVLALLTLLVVALQPGEASACSCAPSDTGEMVERATFVFVGREVAREITKNPWPSVAVTFEVIEAYKGDVGTEITVWTGGGDADCGVSPQSGLVGIAAYADGDRTMIDICGSVHSPAAIAAVADPIDLKAAAPPLASDDSTVPWSWIGGAAAVALIGGIYLFARRRDGYYDGWNSSA